MVEEEKIRSLAQELKEIVSYQKESFIKNTWNKERTKEYFKWLLE